MCFHVPQPPRAVGVVVVYKGALSNSSTCEGRKRGTWQASGGEEGERNTHRGVRVWVRGYGGESTSSPRAVTAQ